MTRHLLLLLLASCAPARSPSPDASYRSEVDAGYVAPESQGGDPCAAEQQPCGAACSRMGLCYVVTPGCQCACIKC